MAERIIRHARYNEVEPRDERVVGYSPVGLVANLVYTLLAILELALLLRLFLSLAAANRANQFANFVYNITAPFVDPFRGLFSVHSVVGLASRFEYEVVVAMIVYAILAAVVLFIARSFNRPIED